MKKYKIVLDAEVRGQTETEELAEILQVVADNTQETTQALNEMAIAQDATTESTNDQSLRLEALGQTLGNVGTDLVHWTGDQIEAAKETTVGAVAMRFMGARLLGLGRLFPIVSTLIISYGLAVKAANEYMEQHVEAQRKMAINIASTGKVMATVWDAWIQKIGEFTFQFKEAFAFTKSIGSRFWLTLFGFDELAFELDKAAKAQDRLTWEFEKQGTEIQKLTYLSEDYLDVINDENRTNEDRLTATNDWRIAQLAILDIEQQRLDDKIIVNKLEKERNAENEAELETLNRELLANGRARENVTKEMAKMNIAILTVNESTLDEIELNYKSIEGLESKAELLAQLSDNLKKAEEAQRKYNEALREEFTFDDEETIEDEGEKLAQDLENTREYFKIVQQDLADHTNSLTRVWQEYFMQVQEYFRQDLEFAKLTTDQKVQVIAGGATLALGIAKTLVNELGAVASDDLETQKKYNQAGIVIDTLMGAVTAFATSLQLGPIAGPIVGGLLSAVIIGLGATAYGKVGQTTADNHPALGGGAGGGGTSVAPSFSLIQPYSPGEQANIEMNNTKQQPVEAFVIGDSIETQTALDRQTRKNATF